MTTTEEMLQAIDNARTFMYSLLDPKQTPRVPQSVRKDARDRLKHFPSQYNTNRIRFAIEFNNRVSDIIRDSKHVLPY
jgi:hypothetical protein